MKGIGWRLFCFIAFPLTLGLTEDAVSSNDLKTDIRKNETSRSGAISASAESSEVVADAEAKESPAQTEVTEDDTANELLETKRFMKDGAQNSLKYQQVLDQERFPNQNDYSYAPNSNLNIQNTNQIIPLNGMPGSDVSTSQVLRSKPNLGQNIIRAGSELNDGKNLENVETQEAYSRVIPYNERILLHKIPGANNLITCSREGELHNFWSSSYQCLVCACIKDTGVLRPVCASCAGCMVQSPEISIYPEIDIPSTPESPVTIAPLIEEEVTCKPLPSGQPFDNPLHPCQVCICIESINAYGKPDVNIKCEENPRCVVPTDVTILPPIPDVPVPSPYCDKFPLNVLFPHPSDSCKTCRCSVQVSQLGIPEKQLTCLPNPDCIPTPEIITDPPVPYPTPIQPEAVPIFEIDVDVTPSPWTPATVAPPHLGPLPGPSPHDSCRPYIPNQPFQHPWDECQMCVCTEAFAKKHVTIEISCFTKKSCCVEPPFEINTPATIAPVPYKQTGQLKFQDSICEYKTFGVEFTHPKDSCSICTCELQGNLITPLCKRSPKPECLISYVSVNPAFGEVISDSTSLPGSANSYNAASSTQNQAIKNAFVTYQNPYGSSGTMGSSQSSADQHASSYNQWSLQNLQRPGALRPYGTQNLPRPGNSHLNYPSYNPHGLGYSPGQQSYSQINYPGSGVPNFGSGYLGYQPGLSRPLEVISQAQTKATASASATAATGLQSNYAYAPGYQYSGGQGLGYPGVKKLGKIKQQQFAQSSASAQSQVQSSSVSSVKYRGRSGASDDEEPADKEN